ncbi:glycosyltransferase family 2 protein [bacterium]|nr:glycosyltransferase family 2 protein [bacterium]
MTITAVVHTYNEEKNLPDCLESLRFADEIVVVDNDSTDQTVAIAQTTGARVVYYHGYYGYPEPARVFGLTQLQGDWVFILDADERITPELQKTLLQLKDDSQAKAGYWVGIRNYHFGRWLKHGKLYPDLHLRFFRRELGSYPEVGLHRGIQVDGETDRLQGDILHFSYRDIQHYFQKFNTYTSVEAKRLITQQHRPTGYDILLKPIHRFLKAYLFQGGILDGLPGLLFHCFSAAYIFSSEAKVWEYWKQQGEILPVLQTLLKRKN